MLKVTYENGKVENCSKIIETKHGLLALRKSNGKLVDVVQPGTVTRIESTK